MMNVLANGWNMENPRSATHRRIQAAALLAASAVVSVILVAIEVRGSVAAALSIGITLLGFGGAVVLIMLHPKEILADTVSWRRVFLHALTSGVLVGLILATLTVVFKEHLGILMGREQRMSLTAAVAALIVALNIIQPILFQRFWPRRPAGARCSACEYPVLPSQQRCSECGSERIIARED
jgi:hypothetical protein